jgi:glycosyltransferase involved in cell wall biosynthesis
MEVSVCVTVLNAEAHIRNLLESLVHQTRKPAEIVVVDRGSTDRTKSIVLYYANKYKRMHIKLIDRECSVGEGKNIAVESSMFDIIVLTQVDCVPDQDWLEKLTNPFRRVLTEVSWSSCRACSRSNSDLAKVYNAVSSLNLFGWGKDFLQSTRSIAFKRFVFEKASGFQPVDDEYLSDVLFIDSLLAHSALTVKVEDALIERIYPSALKQILMDTFRFSLAVFRSNVWRSFRNNFGSYTVEVALKVLYYSFLFFLTLKPFEGLYPVFLAIGIIYLAYFFYKVYTLERNMKLALMSIPLRVLCDIYSIRGALFWALKRK